MEALKTQSTENTVKIVFENEVRKYRNISSYNSLILAIARTMGYGVLNCRFVYRDDDNDEITVSNEEDLAEAFNFFNPKPPRLSLITYDQHVDLALSEIKLWDSFALEDNPDWELFERDSETSTKEKVASPIFKQEVLKETLETKVEDPKEECKEIYESIDAVEPKLEPTDQNVGESVDAKYEVIDITCEIQEDRIKPVIIEPKKEDLEKVKEQTEKKIVEFDEAIESRIKIADDSLINYTDLKEKVTQLAKEQLGILLPKILDECKTYVKNEKSKDKNNEWKQIVHEKIMCDSCTALPIIGTRYHCVVCEDFDLCSNCEVIEVHKHPMLKISSPEKYQAFLKELIRK